MPLHLKHEWSVATHFCSFKITTNCTIANHKWKMYWNCFFFKKKKKRLLILQRKISIHSTGWIWILWQRWPCVIERITRCRGDSAIPQEFVALASKLWLWLKVLPKRKKEKVIKGKTIWDPWRVEGTFCILPCYCFLGALHFWSTQGEVLGKHLRLHRHTKEWVWLLRSKRGCGNMTRGCHSSCGAIPSELIRCYGRVTKTGAGGLPSLQRLRKGEWMQEDGVVTLLHTTLLKITIMQ